MLDNNKCSISIRARTVHYYQRVKQVNLLIKFFLKVYKIIKVKYLLSVTLFVILYCFRRWQAFFTYILPVFMGLGFVRRTNKQKDELANRSVIFKQNY